MHTNEIQDSQFIGHASCDDCGSSDALSLYDDGHTYCFSCETHTQGDNKERMVIKKQDPNLLTNLEYGPLTSRKISEETCRKYGYGFNDTYQVANYRDKDGLIVAQKLRDRNKNFKIKGDASKMELFGQHLWSGGKQIVVCEGEIDTLSMAQVQNLKWACVGIPNGAVSGPKSIKKSIEFLERFEKVIFIFDNDEAGQASASKCADILSAGKAHIAQLPEGFKDINEMLIAGKGAEIISAMWGAKPHRPDGLAFKEDIFKAVTEERVNESIPYPWTDWDRYTYGIRRGELVVITAGTGCGKSTVCRQIAYNLSKSVKVGYIALEENVRQSALQFMGIHTRKPLHLNFDLTEEERDLAFEEVFGDNQIVLYDHFGSLDPDHLMLKIKFLAHAGYKYVFLDHLTLMLSGGADSGDERRKIDSVMTKLRSLVEELDIALFVVSHLKRVDTKPMEEGGRTSLSLLRGSTQIAGLADICIGLERDQQNPDTPNQVISRCLKNRFSGDTGAMGTLEFSKDTMSFQKIKVEF